MSYVDEAYERKPASKSKRAKLKEIFLAWSLEADINGYNKIFAYQSNAWAMLFWVCILITSICLTFYIIASSIVTYLNYDVVSQTSLVYEVPALFPAVTFCLYDPFTSQQAEQLLEFVANQSGIELNPTELNYDLNTLAQMYAANPAYGDENRTRLGLDATLIYNCLFNGANCQSDLTRVYLYEYGSCFQFSSKNATTSISGIDYGLSVSIGPLIDSNRYLTTYESGLVVFVHNASAKVIWVGSKR